MNKPPHSFTYCACCVLRRFSCIWLFATQWSVACQALLSMGFSRQEYWSGLPYPPLEDLSYPGIKPASITSTALAGRVFPTSATQEGPSEVVRSCPTFCDPVDCSLPGSSLHGILQARILEWVAISFSKEGPSIFQIGLSRWRTSKESACQCRRHVFNPWDRKISWRRTWQAAPVFLPGESMDRYKKLDMTEHACTDVFQIM